MGGYIQRDWRIQPPAFTPDYKSTAARSPRLPLLSLPGALADLAGPVFRNSDIGPIDNDLILNYAKTSAPIGERIIVHGRLIDQDGRGIPGALIEIWQANAGGRYRHVNDDYLAAIDPNSAAAAAPSPIPTAATGSARSNPALTVPEFCQQLAAGAHPFLAVRRRMGTATDHADVFRGRSPASTRCHRPHHSGCRCSE